MNFVDTLHRRKSPSTDKVIYEGSNNKRPRLDIEKSEETPSLSGEVEQMQQKPTPSKVWFA